MIIQKNFLAVMLLGIMGYLVLNSGCKDDINLPDQPLDSYNKVYMSAAARGNLAVTLNVSDALQTITYGASIGGYGYPDADIPVSFTVNPQLVAEFNSENNTNYPMLPDESYTLSGNTALIPKGSLSTAPLSISVKTKGAGSITAFRTYILPMSISTSEAAINESLRTTYYLITSEPNLADYPLFDRTGWQIVDKSSEEATGEGSNNGKAIYVLDNVPGTFWHSKWQNGQASPPHYLTVDMGSAHELHGIYLLARQSDNNGKPKDMVVQTSMDNINWTTAASILGQNTRDAQYLWLKEGFPTARYFKIIINNSYNSTVTQIAELNAF